MLIICRDASFSYDGNIVVEGLNFSVAAGDYLCIVGENGSGKSTLIKGLLGLKPPNGGAISFGDGLVKREIGYLPQQTAAQKDFPASVWEVVLSGRLAAMGLRPFYSKQDKAIAMHNIERLGILDIKERCYRELSGGQQQRVLLARALCATQKALLLDEPVSGLDPLVTQELYRLINNINKENGLTVVMVSHDIGNAVKYGSHILHLKKRQLFFGTTAEYVKTPLGRAFLGEEQIEKSLEEGSL